MILYFPRQYNNENIANVVLYYRPPHHPQSTSQQSVDPCYNANSITLYSLTPAKTPKVASPANSPTSPTWWWCGLHRLHGLQRATAISSRSSHDALRSSGHNNNNNNNNTSPFQEQGDRRRYWGSVSVNAFSGGSYFHTTVVQCPDRPGCCL